MRILLYIAIIFIRALLGAYGRLSDKFTGKLTKLQFASLLLMISI